MRDAATTAATTQGYICDSCDPQGVCRHAPGCLVDRYTSDAATTESRPLSGRVAKLTLKRLKDGSVRHWTRVEFEDSPFKSVALSGVIPAGNDPEATLLLALTHRYHLTHALPEPKWSGAR